MKRILLLTLLFTATIAWPAPADPAWEPFLFLTGNWTGEGGGGPGQGSGEFSFHFDLHDKVLVRKNVSNYPATKDAPASSHDDLMVMYRESPTGPFRADYYDSEGHTIRYTVTVTDAGKTIQFLSDASVPGPRYRLTYRSTAKDRVAIKFEIAPPGKPDAFSTYIEASARKLL